MNIVLGLIFFFFAGLIFYILGCLANDLPGSIKKAYSLEWVPTGKPRTLDRFKIDTDNEKITYFYLEKGKDKGPKVKYATHPLGVSNASLYNTTCEIVDGHLVISFEISGSAIVMGVFFFFLALMIIIAGTMVILS